MDAEVKAIMEECSAASSDGRITFPEVVRKLMEAGVERYHADLRRAEITYYLPDGDSHVVKSTFANGNPAQDFSAEGVLAAIRAVQGKRLTYKEFCEQIVAAGCVDYSVSLVGRRAVYFGRTGESHVELFPS